MNMCHFFNRKEISNILFAEKEIIVKSGAQTCLQGPSRAISTAVCVRYKEEDGSKKAERQTVDCNNHPWCKWQCFQHSFCQPFAAQR
jgi:hypothetical protein